MRPVPAALPGAAREGKRLSTALTLAVLSEGSVLSESPVTVVKAARLLDGRGGPPVAPAMVRIEGDRIVEVASRIAIPGGARVIDLGGATLLPGLIDLQTHLTDTVRCGPGFGSQMVN
ncbi:MAG: hypothetical protein ACRD3M_13685 [Thermoanaerobaculia bacterium]